VIVSRVARAHGQDFVAQALRVFAATAYAFYLMLLGEREEALARETADLRRAELTNLAVWDPERLAAERQDLMDRAGLLPSAEEARSESARLDEVVRRMGWLPDAAEPTEATEATG